MTAMEADSGRPARVHDLASMLVSPHPAKMEVPPFAWGFGGLHGGLALALVGSTIQRSAPDQALRSITGQFHRPVRETFRIDTHVIRTGRTAGAIQATGSGAAGVCLTATAILGSDQPGQAPVYAPRMPDVPGPDSLPSLQGLEGKVPVLAQVDVRPIGSVQLYAGAADPVMTAWMRLADRHDPVDPCTVIFFLDALPPSYTAALTEQRPVPSLELSAHLTSAVPTSPWVLVRSTTVRASTGWVTEAIDAWSPDGAHLGSAQQLRLALAPNGNDTMPRRHIDGSEHS